MRLTEDLGLTPLRPAANSTGLRAGIDLVQIKQVEQSIAHFRDRYLNRLFTPREIAYCSQQEPVAAAHFAARFAAKEATLKVLRPAGRWLDWRTIEVTRCAGGWCEVALHGAAADLARGASIKNWSISVTHDGDYAAAVAVAGLECSKVSTCCVPRLNGGDAGISLRHALARLRTKREDRNTMDQRIRGILQQHGRLALAVDSLDEDTDLYRAGMTSHSSVNVMLALESEFDVEFPDRMLRRGVFGTIASIRAALNELLNAPDQVARGG